MGHWHNIMLLLVISFAILHLSHAHSEPDDYVHMHNCIRKALGLPPVVWDAKVEARAKAWAAQRTDCSMIHSDGGGENMAYGADLTGRWAVQMWIDERRNFNYDTLECIGPCGHYTQVIWKNTQKIGCARVQCVPPNDYNYVVVCNYDPPGNYIGEKPY